MGISKDSLIDRLESKIDSLFITQSTIIQKFHYNEWLGNFSDDDKYLAYLLLSRYIYISESNTDLMLSNVIRNLSKDLENPFDHQGWVDFFRSLHFAPVREDDNDFSNSGNLFIGKLKKVIPVKEEQIVGSHAQLYSLLCENKKVVFIDDFVGTGNQFVDFVMSLKTRFSIDDNVLKNIYYCPLLCCRRGYDYILQNIPNINLRPLYILSHRYDIVSTNSVFWPNMSPDWIKEQVDKIMDISRKIGIPEEKILGYKGMGLCISFQHHTPDATLPIFTWNSSGWIPLVGE